MITKERLKELIKQEATIYFPDYFGGKFKLRKEMKFEKNEDLCGEKFTSIVCYCPTCLERFGHGYSWTSLEQMMKGFEKKDDAKFVKKFHCSKEIKFEPPFWEEIPYNSEDCYEYFFTPAKYVIGYIDVTNTKFCKNINVAVENEEGEVTVKGFDFSKQGYIKAVKYAKKLFKGDENETDRL